MIDKIVVRSEFTPIDLLLFRYYRREVPGLVEDTLGRNTGLADHVYLPVGTVVAVDRPDPDVGRRAAIPVIQLYE